jgi:hypothetical protein
MPRSAATLLYVREGLNNVQTRARSTRRTAAPEPLRPRGGVASGFRRVRRGSCALRTDCCHRHQLSSRHPQVRQREQRDNVRVYLARPRKRTFISPNCRLMTRNGCSTLARTLALRCSRFWTAALRRPSGSLAMSLGRTAICHCRCRAPRALARPGSPSRPRRRLLCRAAGRRSARHQPRWPPWWSPCAPGRCASRRRCAPSCRSGESAAGTSPAAARRTVRDTLASYGSHHPTCGPATRQ